MYIEYMPRNGKRFADGVELAIIAETSIEAFFLKSIFTGNRRFEMESFSASDNDKAMIVLRQHPQREAE